MAWGWGHDVAGVLAGIIIKTTKLTQFWRYIIALRD